VKETESERVCQKLHKFQFLSKMQTVKDIAWRILTEVISQVLADRGNSLVEVSVCKVMELVRNSNIRMRPAQPTAIAPHTNRAYSWRQ